MGRQHRWTDEEREIVRRDYVHTHKSRRELATRLGVTEHGVAGQIYNMGIGKRTDRHPWTSEEKERLAELVENFPPRTVARLMNRSVNSVTVKATRLGVSLRVRVGWFTKSEVCQILGTDHLWVQRRIDSGALVASYHSELKPVKGGSMCWHIEERALRDFIRRYPEELNARNVDMVMVVDILVGLKNNEHR